MRVEFNENSGEGKLIDDQTLLHEFTFSSVEYSENINNFDTFVFRKDIESDKYNAVLICGDNIQKIKVRVLSRED